MSTDQSAIIIRVHPALKERIHDAAAAKNMTVVSFVEEIIVNHLGLEENESDYRITRIARAARSIA